MKVRNPRFDFSQVPRYWAAGNPLLTHYLNAFHVLIPEGERFFIRCARPYLESLPEGADRQRCRDFMGQEGWHQAAHRAFWQRLAEQGLPVVRFGGVGPLCLLGRNARRAARGARPPVATGRLGHPATNPASGWRRGRLQGDHGRRRAVRPGRRQCRARSGRPGGQTHEYLHT